MSTPIIHQSNPSDALDQISRDMLVFMMDVLTQRGGKCHPVPHYLIEIVFNPYGEDERKIENAILRFQDDGLITPTWVSGWLNKIQLPDGREVRTQICKREIPHPLIAGTTAIDSEMILTIDGNPQMTMGPDPVILCIGGALHDGKTEADEIECPLCGGVRWEAQPEFTYGHEHIGFRAFSLTKEGRRIARSIIDASSPDHGKQTPQVPLTKTQAEALQYIREHPGSKGLAIALAIKVEYGTFRKHIAPILTGKGYIRNRGGYHPVTD